MSREDMKARRVALIAEAYAAIAAQEDAALDGHMTVMTVCGDRIRAIHAELDKIEATPEAPE
jgi:hypothetical protein